MATMSWRPAISGLFRYWTRFYTLGLPMDVRRDRREEIASDDWEHLHGSSSADDRRTTSDLDLVARKILGIPADISWRFDQGGGIGWSLLASLLVLSYLVVAACAWAAIPVRTRYPVYYPSDTSFSVRSGSGEESVAFVKHSGFDSFTRTSAHDPTPYPLIALTGLAVALTFIALGVLLGRRHHQRSGACFFVTGCFLLSLFFVWSELGPAFVLYVAGGQVLGTLILLMGAGLVLASGITLYRAAFHLGPRNPWLAVAFGTMGAPFLSLLLAYGLGIINALLPLAYESQMLVLALEITVAHLVLISVGVNRGRRELFTRSPRPSRNRPTAHALS